MKEEPRDPRSRTAVVSSAQITHREGGAIELWTELLDDVDGRGYSFESEPDFDECFESYLEEGWTSERGVGRNSRVLGPG